MRHPLHVALSVPVGAEAPAAAVAVARHRKPRRPSPVRAALAATVLTAAVDPAAPVAPDRVPARQSSTFAQVSGN
ncbi:hypothetical protein ABZY81_27215 [Streptomyces sp. NPDC006514]|uniref:hypothetical protein n=1 Tax=Streptomyces sp. NPDC006514 TaxID=3154308 RepID=UPI0033ABD504